MVCSVKKFAALAVLEQTFLSRYGLQSKAERSTSFFMLSRIHVLTAHGHIPCLILGTFSILNRHLNMSLVHEGATLTASGGETTTSASPIHRARQTRTGRCANNVDCEKYLNRCSPATRAIRLKMCVKPLSLSERAKLGFRDV